MKIQRNWFVAAALLLPILFVVFSVGLALASPALASEPTYSFDLTGPQTDKDPNTNHTIALTGAGSFDPSTRTVVASGAFAIFSSSGSPLSFGTWKPLASIASVHEADQTLAHRAACSLLP
jgi:hypothetical protein